MEEPSSAHTFELEAWEGDYAELPPWRDLLATDVSLCDRVFGSKNEAFTAGLYVAEQELLSEQEASTTR